MITYTKGKKWKNKHMEGFRIFLSNDMEIHVKSDLPHNNMEKYLWCEIHLCKKRNWKREPYKTLKSVSINLLDENAMKIHEVIDILILDASNV